MNFNSLIFLIYLPVVVFLYWVLPYKVRWIFLLLASYFFYAYTNPWLLILIGSTTLVSYLCALGIGKTEKKGWKRFYLAISLVFLLGMLFVFKYLDFAVGSVFSLMNLFCSEATYTPFNLILPVGISFYTFQTMSYVIDVYHGVYPAERHLGYFALFVSFFPQLVAGPIERPQDLLPQLKEEHHLSSDCFSCGFQYLICGFVKKIVIADFLGTYVASIYGNVAESSGVSLMIATFFFALQIYGDFSGYSDIAIGCAHLMGIHLSRNFNHPYLSRSVREFYRRWHITLNNWLINYVYIPLGGSRCSTFRHLLNIMVVFLVSGFWHGARWNYVLWGVLNGLLIVIEILLDKPFTIWKNRSERRRKAVDFISIPITFLLISATWVFFRSQDVSTAFLVYQRIFTCFVNGKGMESFKNSLFCIRVFITLLLSIGISYLPRLDFHRDRKGNFDIKNISSTLSLYAVLVFIIGYCWMNQLMTSGESGCIYVQF